MSPSPDRNSLLFRRLAAFLVDSFLLGAVQLFVVLMIFFPLFHGLQSEDMDRFFQKMGENPMMVFGVFAAYFGVILFFFLFSGLYFTLLQSSSWQATLGKKLLGLKVTDMEGCPIRFGKAFLRYFIRALLSTTGVLVLADFIVGFTNDEGQTIHDLAAKTLVVDQTSGSPPLGR